MKYVKIALMATALAFVAGQAHATMSAAQGGQRPGQSAQYRYAGPWNPNGFWANFIAENGPYGYGGNGGGYCGGCGPAPTQQQTRY